MKRTLLIIAFVSALFSSNNVNGKPLNNNSDDSLSLSLNADFVSRYLWRGLLYSGNPNIQPYASLAYKGLTFGAWGSFGISTPWAETDFYLSYSAGPVTFTVSDYYVASDDDLTNYNYFNFKKKETSHSLEGQISYTGPETLPITLTAATFFAGADDSDGDDDNDYSTYFEVAYTSQISGLPVKLYVGGTPSKGIYSTNANIVNIGVNISKTLKFSEKLEIPVFGNIVVNPNSEDMFFVFGITF